jgi:2-iminobutanoate/2-iminopropanoate deaminase
MKKVINTANAPAAIGPYSQAIEANGMVFISGQVPINPASAKVEETSIEGQSKQVMENLKAVLAEADLTFDHVIKSTILLQDLSDFGTVNEIYGSYLSEPYPARATFQVARLPLDVKIEVEMIAAR